MEVPVSNYWIVTYDLSCESYFKLKSALGATGIKPEESSYRYRDGDVVLNWGLYGERSYPIVMNQFWAVKNSSLKLEMYERFREAGIPHPRVMLSQREALQRLANGETIYARSTDRGCRGAGITVCHKGDSLPYSKFYTVGFPTNREFRIYVAYGQVFDIREKIKPRDVDVDPEVRANDDWLYSIREPAHVPSALLQAAINAAKACSLDFVGVDVALDTEENVTVFEVNTAPWLGKLTAKKLASIIKERFP